MFDQTKKSKFPNVKKQQGLASKRVVVSLFLVFGVTITAWFMNSQTFSSDTSQIGKGKPVAMLLYQNASHDVSVNLKYGYKKLRKKYQDQIELLVVNTLSPNGIHFLQRSDAEAGTILYYNAEGDQIAKIIGPKSVDDLDKLFKQTFGL